MESFLDRDVTQGWVCSGCCGSHQHWAMSLSPGSIPRSVGASGGISVLDKHQVTATQLQHAKGFSLCLKPAVPSSSSGAWRVLVEGAGEGKTATKFPAPGSPPASLHRTGSVGCPWSERKAQGEHKHGQLHYCSQGEVSHGLLSTVLGISCGLLQGSGLALVLCNAYINHLGGG